MPAADVIERFRAGDADAIRELYREHAGAVMTVAVSIVRDRELAADVVQQTFVKAWRASETFRGDRQFTPWLYSIARHTAIDALRAESKPTRGGHAPEVDVQVDGVSMESLWEGHEIRRALDALPPDEREVIRRSHLLGETHDQIAQQLGIPIGTVKSRTSRAHKRLAIALAHLADDHANHDGVQAVVQAEEEP
jgi:RNA polymerase sigma-70 factor (ECF subfamily)